MYITVSMATSVIGVPQQEDNEEKNESDWIERGKTKQNPNTPHISGERGNNQRKNKNRGAFQKRKVSAMLASYPLLGLRVYWE